MMSSWETNTELKSHMESIEDDERNIDDNSIEAADKTGIPLEWKETW